MNPQIIAGVGNIYSDEALWLSGIHPETKVSKIPDNHMKLLYTSVKAVLRKGIDFGGDSMSDYRNLLGERGEFQGQHNAYRKTGTQCKRKGCKGVIQRKVVNTRSAHFCSIHQKLQ
jgi:formamidopyrimidine-DNA glycosylase